MSSFPDLMLLLAQGEAAAASVDAEKVGASTFLGTALIVSSLIMGASIVFSAWILTRTRKP